MSPVPGEPDGVGAGSTALLHFADPLSAKVLRAHVEGPLRPAELKLEVDWAARTTLRTCVTNLEVAGALDKNPVHGAAYAVETHLTSMGREMILVAAAVESWLALSPAGPIAPDSGAAKTAVKALVGGWNSTVMQALAIQPHSLAELDTAIRGLNYPLLKRRVAALRLNHQIEKVVGTADRAPNPYAATDWMRRSIAPIAVAARCELRQAASSTTSIGDGEMQTALLLTSPLVSLVASAVGTCTMGVEQIAGEGPVAGTQLPGATVRVAAGKITSWAGEAEEGQPGWALGTARTWLDAFIDGPPASDVRFSTSDPQPVTELVSGIHQSLFGQPALPEGR